MAQRKSATTPRPRRKKQIEPKSRGLTPAQVAAEHPPAKVVELGRSIEKDGGSVLASYRDPLGGNWQLLAALPIDKVQPTPFQRDLSEAHVKRLSAALDRLDRFLDPIIAVRKDEGIYWTPNGNHRRATVEALGGKSIIALVVPEEEMAYEILTLNTEKSHNLREKCLEVIRMARDIAGIDPAPERDYASIFEEPQFLTLGLCYEQRGRFAGGAYQPVLKRLESFLAQKLPKALETRSARVEKLFALDDAVSAAVKALKERGFESPYLKNFVIARVNPLRFERGTKADFDETIDKMVRGASRFDASKIKVEQVARSGGAPEE